MASWLENKIESADDPGAHVATARALDADFTPHATKHTLCMYTIELTCDDGEEASVELRTDAATPPVTPRASARFKNVACGAVSVVRQQLTCVVQPGQKVRLVKAGAGDAAIAHQTEMIIS